MAGYETLGRFTWQGIRPWGDLLGRVLDPGEIYLAVYQALGNLLAMVSDPGDYCFCNFFYSLESYTSVIQIFKLTILNQHGKYFNLLMSGPGGFDL